MNSRESNLPPEIVTAELGAWARALLTAAEVTGIPIPVDHERFLKEVEARSASR